MSDNVKVKKGHPVLVTLLVLFTVLIVLPVGLAYALFFDSTTHTQTTTQTEMSQVIQDSLFDSFKPAKQKGKLEFKVTQDQLNAAFNSVYKQMPTEAQKYVSGIYVDVNNTNYDFYVEAGIPIFKSRAIIRTEMTDVVNETSPLDGYFQFKIKEIQVGRINGIVGLINTFAKDPMTQAMNNLQSSLARSGLHLTVSWADQAITYTKANLLTDMTGKLGSNNQLVSSALEEFLSSNVVTLNGQAGTNLEIDTNLAKFHTKAGYVDEANDLNLKLEDYIAKLQTLIDNNVLLPASENLAPVFTYLIRGYDDVAASTKSIVDGLDLSTIGITDKAAYKGANLTPETSLEDKVKSQITIAGIAAKKIAKISEADINEMLAGTGLIGNGTVMARKNGQNPAEAVYFVFDNFNANILNDKMYFTAGLSVNGYETRAIITTTMTSFADYKMTLKVDGWYLGESNASAAMKTVIQDKIASGFSGEGAVSYDANSGSFVLDFSQAVQDSGMKVAIELAGTPQATLIGASITDENACLDLTIN